MLDYDSFNKPLRMRRDYDDQKETGQIKIIPIQDYDEEIIPVQDYDSYGGCMKLDEPEERNEEKAE